MRMLVILLVFFATACSGSAVTGPPGAEPFDPPPNYALWWRDVQRDAGQEVATMRIRWYVVPEPWWSEDAGRFVQGGWTASGRIYLAADFVGDEGLVKHELLHEWIYQTGDKTGDPNHTHPLFQVYTPQP